MEVYIAFEMYGTCQPFTGRNDHTPSTGFIASFDGFTDSFCVYMFPSFDGTVIRYGVIFLRKDTFFDRFHGERGSHFNFIVRYLWRATGNKQETYKTYKV